MKEIMEFIFRKYGASAILVSIVAAIFVWVLAHFSAEPGTKVSVIWGLAEYTKPNIQNYPSATTSQKESAKEASEVDDKQLMQTSKPASSHKAQIPDTSISENFSNLTVEEITKKINNAPPYQAKNVAQSFVGIKVKWLGWLDDVEIRKDAFGSSKISVKLSTKKNALHSIYFETTIDEHPEFKILEKGSIIAVTGIIERASGPGLNVSIKPIQISTDVPNL